MQELLKKLAKGKKGHEAREMHPIEQKAKMAAMHELHKMAQDLMGEHLHGLKKVSVESPSEHGLEAGLATAKDLLQGKLDGHDVSDVSPELSDEMKDEALELPEEEVSESPEEQAHEANEGIELHHPEESEEELDARIKELMEKKDRLKAKK